MSEVGEHELVGSTGVKVPVAIGTRSDRTLIAQADGWPICGDNS